MSMILIEQEYNPLIYIGRALSLHNIEMKEEQSRDEPGRPIKDSTPPK